MSENHPVAHPLPEGVHDNFTYACNTCGGTVTVVASTRQPHICNLTDRDELAALLKAERWKRFSFIDEDGNHDGGIAEQSNQAVAAAILAAGYRKPKQATTAAELDKLGFQSVVLDVYGTPYVCERHRVDGTRNEWKPSGMNHLEESEGILYHGPATVLHVGGAE